MNISELNPEMTSEELREYGIGALKSFAQQRYRCYVSSEEGESQLLRDKIQTIHEKYGLSWEEMGETLRTSHGRRGSKGKMLKIIGSIARPQ